jgi:hypothetical protein
MISVGTILIENGTPVPESFRSGTDSYPHAWTSLTKPENFQDFDKDLAATDGLFFAWPAESRASPLALTRKRGWTPR